MEQMTANPLIGKSLITFDLGIGEIKDVTSLQEGGEEFFRVMFPNSNGTNYFSVSNRNNYRIVSTKKEINKAVKVYKSEKAEDEFSSVQEKINFYKSALRENDICVLAGHLSALADKEDEMHAQVKKHYTKAMESFVNEIKYVLDIKKTDVMNLLGIEK